MAQRNWLSEPQEFFDEIIKREFEKCASAGEVIELTESLERKLPDIVTNAIEEMASVTWKALRDGEETHVNELEGVDSRFAERNYERWKPAFDLLQSLITVCIETGQQHATELGEQAKRDHDLKFFALHHLHARALLVSNEIKALLRAGYPDGALGRWRSLHQIHVFISFVSKYRDPVARRFFVSFEFQALRAMEQINFYSSRTNLTPFSEADIDAQRTKCDVLTMAYGDNLKEDLGWASNEIGKARPNLRDLEIDVELDHWRPYFRWASQNIHGSFRLSDRMLGMTEAKAPVNLVGSSNSGFVEPFHMTAISLAGATSKFLMLDQDLARLSIVRVLQKYCDAIADTAQSCNGKQSP